jgi:ribonuclease J
MIDHMVRRGAEGLYGSMNPPEHVSGHANMEEMNLVLNLVRPRYFMPIHGEFRQLTKHARLAEHLRASCLEETFVMESGDVLEIDHHGARKAGKVTVGRVRIDSGSVDDVVEEMVIRGIRPLRWARPARGHVRVAGIPFFTLRLHRILRRVSQLTRLAGLTGQGYA